MTHVSTSPPVSHPSARVRLGRRIRGASAVLMPFAEGAPDLEAFVRHLRRTAAAGLTPAVNMDTGYVHMLTPAQQTAVLDAARSELAGAPFIAGVFVADTPGQPFQRDAYLERATAAVERGATPIIFQSFGLTSLRGEELIRAYAELGSHTGGFLGFELGPMFAPFGTIYDLEVFEALLGIAECRGLKHSSLSRQLEWQRLELIERVRPDFSMLTGNDLAIDMVMYGSDYLLGLSSFWPELFAKRDRLWESGDPGFYELNDLLQYLGHFTFRSPVPAYRHSAAQFLHLRGLLDSSEPAAGAPRRPESDLEVLKDIKTRLEAWA